MIDRLRSTHTHAPPNIPPFIRLDAGGIEPCLAQDRRYSSLSPSRPSPSTDDEYRTQPCNQCWKSPCLHVYHSTHPWSINQMTSKRLAEPAQTQEHHLPKHCTVRTIGNCDLGVGGISHETHGHTNPLSSCSIFKFPPLLTSHHTMEISNYSRTIPCIDHLLCCAAWLGCWESTHLGTSDFLSLFAIAHSPRYFRLPLRNQSLEVRINSYYAHYRRWIVNCEMWNVKCEMSNLDFANCHWHDQVRLLPRYFVRSSFVSSIT